MKNCEQLEHLFLIHACMLPQKCVFERFEILPATVFGNFSSPSSSSFGSLISPLTHIYIITVKIWISNCSRFCLFQAQLNSLTLRCMMQFHAGFYCLFMKILSGDIFPSLAIHIFFPIFAFAFKKAKRYKKDSIVKAISASLWKRKEKKEIHLLKEIRDDFL